MLEAVHRLPQNPDGDENQGHCVDECRQDADTVIAKGLASISRAFGLSQEEFAAQFHIPIGTLRDWEQGRKEPDAARPYKVPGYPIVPWVFILFATLYLGFTVYNDIIGYQAAVAAGKPAIINSAFGTVLVLIGTPIYFFYRRILSSRPRPSS